MFHYEVFSNHTPASYDKVIESFKVVPFADAVETTKAGYVIFTVGQHWGKFCAPNSAYERLLGVETGVWTSKRDLIMEIGKELQRRNIRLILYMTARAPMRHYKIIKAMGDALPTINGKPAGPGVNTMSHPRKLKGFRRSENQAPPPRFLSQPFRDLSRSAANNNRRNDLYPIFGGIRNDLINLKRADEDVILLPIHSDLTESQVQRVIRHVKKYDKG